jgi:hypothetical protein
MLGVWPALPLHIDDCDKNLRDIVAVLKRSDRVHVIYLWRFPNSHWELEKLSAAMQVPFPKLRYLQLCLSTYGEAILPDSFLGGSAPSLRYLHLDCITFPGLPKLLLSTIHLVDLHLWNIPHSGYISPKATVTALSALTHLDKLTLRFRSPLSRPDRASRLLPPPTRSVLSILTDFSFKGDSEYLDDLVAHIDAPRLNYLNVTFFNDILFDTPQLMRFICRTPTLKPLEMAKVYLGGDSAVVYLSSLRSRNNQLRVEILCTELDWQVLLLHQVITSSFPSLSTLDDLYIDKGGSLFRSQQQGENNIENSLWLELLLPFRIVKNLCVSKEFVPRMVSALQELVGIRATEVLPTLQNIFLEGLEPSGPVQEGIQQFVDARQDISDPIAVSPWDGKERWSRFYGR